MEDIMDVGRGGSSCDPTRPLLQMESLNPEKVKTARTLDSQQLRIRNPVTCPDIFEFRWHNQYLTKYCQNKTFVLRQLHIIIDNYKQIKEFFQ